MAVWLLRLSIVSFADSSAAGKQPAEYPDPELIQVVDKNERVYGGAAPQGCGSGLAPTDALALGPGLRGQSKPPVKGLWRFEPTSLGLDLTFLPFLDQQD